MIIKLSKSYIFYYFLLFSLLSSAYTTKNTQNNIAYKDILLANNVIRTNWVVLRMSYIPVYLQQFATAKSEIFINKDGTKEEGMMLPLNVLVFQKDDNFEYVWRKTNTEIGRITGTWDIENKHLILILNQDYTESYPKGTEFRYKITGTNHKKTQLEFEGTEFPPITGIVKTSNNPTSDLSKIIVSKDQTSLTDQLTKQKESDFQFTPIDPKITTYSVLQPETTSPPTPPEEKAENIKLDITINDTITIPSSDKWNINILKYTPYESAYVVIKPKENESFLLELEFKGEVEEVLRFETPEKIKTTIEASISGLLGTSAENSLKIEELSLKNDSFGFYTIMTDKKLAEQTNIPEGEFKYFIRGIIKSSPTSVLDFSLLINELNTPLYNEIFDYIKELL